MEFGTLGRPRNGARRETQRKLAIAGLAGDGGQVVERGRASWLLLENADVQLLGLLGLASLLAPKRQPERMLQPRWARGLDRLGVAAGPDFGSVPSHTYSSAEHPTEL